jgi:hypothetical protein
VLASARGDADAVYAAGAAEHTRAERARISALLERHGAVVVEVPARNPAGVSRTARC